MLQLKRKSLRLPDGLLTKVYKDIVNGYHNENCWNRSSNSNYGFHLDRGISFKMPYKVIFHLLKRPLSSTKVPGRPARHCASRSGETGGQKRQPSKWKIFLWGCPQWNKTTKAFHGTGRWSISKLRNRDKITFIGRRIDSGQICTISNYKSWWNSELFWYFWNLASCIGGLKL